MIARLVLLAFLILSSALAQGASQDDDFLAAREAFRVGDAKKLDFYAQRLKGYLLESYVTYWRLRTQIDKADPEAIRAFIRANGDSPLAGRLRVEWLKQLGKSGQWDLFDAEYPGVANPDIELTCYALQSKLRTDEAQALTEARPLWFVGRELPDSCVPLFDALVAAKQLSDDDLWTRIRLELEAGHVTQARRIAEFLPRSRMPDGRVLGAIASNSRGFLDKKNFDLKSRAGRETVMFAAYRLARTSPSQAAAQWTRIGEGFSDEERTYVWGLIAYYGALRHDPDALAWYAQAGDGLSDVQLAWKARAALRTQDWDTVLGAVDAMTLKESGQANWRYWRARALKALGRTEEAEAIFKPLATEFNFYGQLATEELGGSIATPATAFKPGAEDLRAISRLPGIRRALALYRLDLRLEATREWLWAIRGFDDKQLLTAAEVARRYEIYDRAINTADKTVLLHDFSLRYLAPYRDVLKARAEELGLDEAWVYGLIRQESRFVAEARSRAGARGLMQLMPATARWVAKKLGLKDWRWTQTNEVDVNVNLGTYYLRHVLDLLDGDAVLASTAYNAGPGRARRWRPATPIEGAVYAETIPFNETRDYVEKVMSNATYYARAFGQQLQSLKRRLGVIEPQQYEAGAKPDDTP